MPANVVNVTHISRRNIPNTASIDFPYRKYATIKMAIVIVHELYACKSDFSSDICHRIDKCKHVTHDFVVSFAFSSERHTRRHF